MSLSCVGTEADLCPCSNASSWSIQKANRSKFSQGVEICRIKQRVEICRIKQRAEICRIEQEGVEICRIEQGVKICRIEQEGVQLQQRRNIHI